MSKNLHRRHLSAGQKAFVALEVEKLYAAEAKERQKEHGNTAPGKPKSLPPESAEVSSSPLPQIEQTELLQVAPAIEKAKAVEFPDLPVIKDPVQELPRRERESATRAAKLVGVGSTAAYLLFSRRNSLAITFKP